MMETELDRKLVNPFPGLRPFESHEARLFFGRDGQSDQLLGKLSEARFVAVVGPSGSGKSSLVRAGLLPALYSGIAVTGSDWRVAVSRPGGDPMGNLARSLLSPHRIKSNSHQVKDEIYLALCETILRRNSKGLIEATNWLKKGMKASFANMLVIIDQFEELFRYKQDADDRRTKDVAAAFVKLLLTAAIEQKDVPIYVVLTMRSDYLGDCAQFLGLPEAINKGQYLIPRMTRGERRAAIEGPIGVCHGGISQLLVNRLLNDAGDEPENLPILQHALMRTWDEWVNTDQDIIELNHYYAIGGMESALSRHGDEVYASLSGTRQQEIARKLFTYLVETDQEGRTVRHPTPLRAICQVIQGDQKLERFEKELSEVAREVIPVIETFRSPGVSFLTPPRSIKLDAEYLDTVIDISHESLISGWEALRDWASSEAESAMTYRRLAETATLHSMGRAALYRGRDLKIASEWQENFRPSRAWALRYHTAFDKAVDFLRKSKYQKIIFRLVVLATVLVTAGVGFIYLNNLRNINRSERLAVNANERSQSDPRAGLELAVEAMRTYETENAVQALRNSLFENSARITIQPIQVGPRRYGVISSAFSPNGNFVLTANRDGKAYIWLVSTESDEATLVDSVAANLGFITSASFDPQGRKIIITGRDKKAVVWEVNPDTGRIGNKVAELSGHTEIINRAAFSPDGRYAITASSDGTARVWDLNQVGGKEVALLEHKLKEQKAKPDEQNVPPSVWVKSAMFNPADDRYILTASWDGTARLWYWNRLNAAVEQKPIDSFIQKDGINNAVFSRDGAYIVTAGNDGKAKVLEWNQVTGKFGRVLSELPHDAPVLDAAFNPTDKDTRNIITACADKEARLWKLSANSSDSPTADISLRAHSDWVTTVSFSQSGQFILTTGYDGTALVWRDVGKQEKLERYLEQSSSDPVLSVAFNNDGKRFLTGSRDGSVRLWEVTLKKVPLEAKLAGAALDAIFVGDGKLAKAAGSNGGVVLLDLINKQVSGINAQNEAILSVTFSPDGKQMASRGQDGSIIVWDLSGESGQSEAVLSEEGLSIAFSSDGKLLAFGGQDGRVRVRDISGESGQTNMKDVQQSGAPVNSIAFRPKSNQIVTASNDGTTRLLEWDMTKSYIIKSWSQTSPVRCAVFSPDGNSIATVGDDGIILIRNVEDSRILQQITGYEGSIPLPIFRAKFSHNGKYLATTDFDTVKVWDVKTGKQLAKIVETSTDPRFAKETRENPNPTFSGNLQNATPLRLVNNLAFSPDDKYIITARSDNKPVHIFAWLYFPISTAELMKKAETLLNR